MKKQSGKSRGSHVLLILCGICFFLCSCARSHSRSGEEDYEFVKKRFSVCVPPPVTSESGKKVSSMRMVHLVSEQGIKITKKFTWDGKMSILSEYAKNPANDTAILLNDGKFWISRGKRTFQEITDPYQKVPLETLYALLTGGNAVDRLFYKDSVVRLPDDEGSFTKQKKLLSQDLSGVIRFQAKAKNGCMYELTFDNKLFALLSIRQLGSDFERREEFSNYRLVNNVFLPTVCRVVSGDKEMTYELLSVEVNPEFAPEEFLPCVETDGI